MSREQREKAKQRQKSRDAWDAVFAGKYCTLHGTEFIDAAGRCAICVRIELYKQQEGKG